VKVVVSRDQALREFARQKLAAAPCPSTLEQLAQLPPARRAIVSGMRIMGPMEPEEVQAMFKEMRTWVPGPDFREDDPE
jgi:hypothetical protein